MCRANLAVEAKLEDDEEEECVDAYAYNEPGSPPGTLEIAADAEPPTIMLIDYSYRAHQLQRAASGSPQPQHTRGMHALPSYKVCELGRCAGSGQRRLLQEV